MNSEYLESRRKLLERLRNQEYAGGKGTVEGARKAAETKRQWRRNCELLMTEDKARRLGYYVPPAPVKIKKAKKTQKKPKKPKKKRPAGLNEYWKRYAKIKKENPTLSTKQIKELAKGSPAGSGMYGGSYMDYDGMYMA